MKQAAFVKLIAAGSFFLCFWNSVAVAAPAYTAEAVGPGWTCAQYKNLIAEMASTHQPEAKLICQICRDENNDGQVDSGFEVCPDPNASGGGCPPAGCEG